MKNISNTQNAKHSNKVTRKQKLAQGRLNWWREPSYRHRLQMHWFNLCLAGFICVELFCLIFMTLFSFGSVGSALAWLIMINYNIPEARRRENESCKHLSLISGYFALLENLRKVLFLVVSIVLACERKTDFQTWTRAKQEFDKFLFSTFPQSNFASTL